MKTRSNIIKRLLSLALCICMVLALLPVIAPVTNAASITGETKLYLKPNANWKEANARFAAYFFNNSKNAWASMSDPDGNGIYECIAPSGTWTNVIFCRMNPANSTNNWNQNTNLWNQTSDLVYDGSKNLYSVKEGTWDKGGGTWSTECQNLKYPHNFVNNKCGACGTQGVTIYFQNNWEWEDVCVHYMKGNVKSPWPGFTADYHDKATVNGKEVHFNVITIPEDVSIIINGKDENRPDHPDETATIKYADCKEGDTFYIESGSETGDQGQMVCTLDSYPICKDFPKKHEYDKQTDLCITCNESYCRINGHKFGSGLGENDLCERCGAPSMTIFFKSTWGWTDVYLHDWYEGTDVNNGWPGEKMSIYTSMQSGADRVEYYYMKLPLDIAGLNISGIKNDTSGVRDQSPDIPIDKLYHGVCFEMFYANGENTVKSFDINDVYKCLLGHIYGETQYTWADDYSSCTASRTCTRCTDTETATVDGVKSELGAGNCQDAAQLKYDASFAGISWAEDQTAPVVGAENPNNHVDREAIYVDNGDGTHDQKWNCCGVAVVEGEAHADADQSGRCDSCSALMVPAALRKASVSLKGNIAVNYYMLMSEKLLSDETAYMQFTMANGEIRKVPASEGVKLDYEGETYYVYSCEVSAKEMTDNIISQFFYDNTATEEHPYSVRTYAEHILKSDKCTDAHNLIKAMVNYGAASQLHFNYKTDDLANSFLTEQPDYSTVTVPDTFKPITNQGTAQTKLYSVSLVLKSETTLRFFFQGKVTEATYNGQKLNVFQRNGLYCVDVTDIAAKDLDDEITITINDGSETASVTCSAMTYCWIVQIDDSGAFDEAMKDLASALYLYNQAANAYFKESN